MTGPASDTALPGSGIRLLYIEDDLGLARLLQKSLARHGYQVDLAPDGAAGLALAQERAYDAILTDREMPVMNGLEVVRTLAADPAAPPVVMVTGNGSEQVAVEAMRLGAADYVVKDVDMGYLELLPAVIAKVLAGHALLRERAQMLVAMQESEERYRLLVDLSPDGIAIHSARGFRFVNPAGLRLLGVAGLEDLAGKELLDLVHPDDRASFQAQLMQFETAGCDVPWLELRFVRADGAVVDVEFSGVLFNYQGDPAAQVVFRDISERRQAKAQLEHAAKFDSLTGLPNRLLFFDRLECAVTHCRRYRETMALMFLDLDRFKQVNDTLGHAAGDLLLKEVAVRLEGCLRGSDTVARMGGDEFTIILPRLNLPDDAVLVAEKIIAALNAPFTINGQACSIGVSIGISTFVGEGDGLDALVKEADSAMYVAKESGRNTYRFFPAPTSPVA